MEILRLLVDSGAPLNARGENGNTAIMAATYGRHLRAIEYLLTKGADISIPCNEGSFPLYCACQIGYADALELLLSGGACADINRQMSSTGGTPIMAASNFKHIDCVRVMLEAGADVSHKNPHGFTALLMAKDFESMKLLIEGGASVQDVDCHGQNVLHKGVALGFSPEAFSYLIAAGADPYAVDSFDQIPATALNTPVKVRSIIQPRQAPVEDGRKVAMEYYCAQCFAKASLRCGRCKRVYFCSAECQKLKHKEHKKVCVAPCP